MLANIINDRYISYLKNIAFSRKTKLFVMGGYLRDIALGLTPCDIDVISFAPLRELKLELPLVRTTGLGGLGYLFSNEFSLDIWYVKDTYAYLHASKKRKRKLKISKYPVVEDVFNVNSIVYDIVDDIIYERNFYSALESRTIDFQDTSYLYHFPELQCMRAFCLVEKLQDFKLSKRVKNFIFHIVSCQDKNAFISNLGNSKYNNSSLIENLYNEFYK